MDGEIVALDQGQPVKYVVRARAVDNRLVRGPLKMEEKSNEITAVPKLLRALDLAGGLVTLDAMGCQKAIIEADADYVRAFKGNQGTAHEELKTFLDQAIAEATQARDGKRLPQQLTPLNYPETIEKNGGRIETRRYWHPEAVSWFCGAEVVAGAPQHRGGGGGTGAPRGGER